MSDIDSSGSSSDIAPDKEEDSRKFGLLDIKKQMEDFKRLLLSNTEKLDRIEKITPRSSNSPRTHTEIIRLEQKVEKLEIKVNEMTETICELKKLLAVN